MLCVPGRAAPASDGARPPLAFKPTVLRIALHTPFAMLAGENISARFVVPTVASSVDLVVHLGIDHEGVRRVNEVVAVPGRVENDIIEIEPIFHRVGGELCRASGMPARLDRFHRIGVDVHRLLAEPEREDR